MSGPKGPRNGGNADDGAAQPDTSPSGTPGEDNAEEPGNEVTDQGAPADDGGDDEWALGETEGDARTIAAFLVGALVGLVSLGLVWGTTVLLTGGDGSEVAASMATATVTLGADSNDDTATPAPTSRIDRCRRADAALAESLRAAVPALDQWEVHVGAMNKLVVGAITLRQANAFWNRTRVGAGRRLDSFYAAARRSRSAGTTCPSPRHLTQASAGLRSCAERVVAEQQALEAARIAMRTWKAHVRHMEMLRMGQMSPTTATRLWLANWRRGVQQIRTYRIAEPAVKGSGSC
jgi:hypothetical protein